MSLSGRRDAGTPGTPGTRGRRYAGRRDAGMRAVVTREV